MGHTWLICRHCKTISSSNTHIGKMGTIDPFNDCDYGLALLAPWALKCICHMRSYQCLSGYTTLHINRKHVRSLQLLHYTTKTELIFFHIPSLLRQKEENHEFQAVPSPLASTMMSILYELFLLSFAITNKFVEVPTSCSCPSVLDFFKHLWNTCGHVLAFKGSALLEDGKWFILFSVVSRVLRTLMF